MHGPDRQTFLAGACKQRNEAGFQSYLQRCSNLHPPSSQNPKLFNSGPDNELKSTLDISPNPEDLWEQHPGWTSVILPHFGGEEDAAQGFRFGAQDELTPDLNSSQNCSGTESSILNSPFSSSLDFWSVPNNFAANIFSPPRPQTNKWSASLAELGSPEAQFSLNSNLSLDQLCQTTLEDFGKLELLEKIFGLLQIHHVYPLGFSQQFEAQQGLPEKVFYVAGCRRCCFIFNVEATLRAHQEEWISVEILVCPPTL